MIAPAAPPSDRCPIAGVLALLALLVAGLCAWQTTRADPEAAVPAYPYLAGQHPHHQYAAHAVRVRQRLSGFDPQLQAGAPLSHVADYDARLPMAAALLSLPEPDAYRIALLVAAMLPVVGAGVAGRTLGRHSWPGAIATMVACGLMWWGPGAGWLREGYISRLLVLGLVPMQLAAWERSRGGWTVRTWLLSATTHAAGLFLHAPLWLGVVAVEASFWLGVARRSRGSWTTLQLFALGVAVAVNVPTFAEHARFWWTRSPLLDSRLDSGVLIDSLARKGDAIRPFAWAALTALAGAVVTAAGQRFTPAFRTGRRLLAFALLCGLAAIALASLRDDAPAATTAAWLGVWCLLPALAATKCALVGRCHHEWRVAGPLVGGTIAVAAMAFIARPALLTHWPRPDTAPLTGRWGEAERGILAALKQQTAPTARVVWEERSGAADGWTRLLPLLTDRAFVGGGGLVGLECDGITLRDGRLLGRPLEQWTDDELEGYCRRLNVGWFVARTAATRERLSRWKPAAEAVCGSDPSVTLFSINRPHSWCLRGSANVEWLSDGRLRLTDLQPEQGELLLSLHGQDGVSAQPRGAAFELEPDAADALPLLRLRLDGPLRRVTLGWQSP